MKHLFSWVALALMGAIGCSRASDAQLVATEHGYQTKYVIATRYQNDFFGYNIGFRFPHHPYDSDSRELFEFIEKEGHGAIFQGGGSPGAEVFAKFEGVVDKESANKFLTDGFLVKLDRFMSTRQTSDW
jgi:hypothetical protein